MEMEKDQGLRAPPASQDRVTDERSPEDGSPPYGSVPHGAGDFAKVTSDLCHPLRGVMRGLYAEYPNDKLLRVTVGELRRIGRFVDGAAGLYEALTAAANALQHQARMVTEHGSSPTLRRKQVALQEQADSAFAALRKARGEA